MVKRWVNRTGRALLAAGISMSCALAGGSRDYRLALPDGIDTARSVALVLSEVRLPRKTAVVLRARMLETVADGTHSEIPLGSIGLLAESKNAEGTALRAALRIDVTKALKRWRQDHPGVREIRIRVVPYAGATPLPDLEWSAGSAALVPSGD